MAADLCKPEDMAKIVRYSSGVICVGMEGERMDELKLPAMVSNNEDPKGTAFSVSVDAVKEHGEFVRLLLLPKVDVSLSGPLLENCVWRCCSVCS